MFQHMKCDEYRNLFQAPRKIVTAMIVKTDPKNDERELGPLPDHARLNFNLLVFASFLLSEKLTGLRKTALTWYEKQHTCILKLQFLYKTKLNSWANFFFCVNNNRNKNFEPKSTIEHCVFSHSFYSYTFFPNFCFPFPSPLGSCGELQSSHQGLTSTPPL